jgi:hypothetical protein
MKPNQTLDSSKAGLPESDANRNIVSRAWFNFCKNNWQVDHQEEPSIEISQNNRS